MLPRRVIFLKLTLTVLHAKNLLNKTCHETRNTVAPTSTPGWPVYPADSSFYNSLHTLLLLRRVARGKITLALDRWQLMFKISRQFQFR